MKRIGILLLALALATTGCVEFPTWTDAKTAPAKESTPLAPVERPPVIPDQVSEGNAPQALNALREELDRAANANTPAPKP